jgi:hypothetical protein
MIGRKQVGSYDSGGRRAYDYFLFFSCFLLRCAGFSDACLVSGKSEANSNSTKNYATTIFALWMDSFHQKMSTTPINQINKVGIDNDYHG